MPVNTRNRHFSNHRPSDTSCTQTLFIWTDALLQLDSDTAEAKCYQRYTGNTWERDHRLCHQCYLGMGSGSLLLQSCPTLALVLHKLLNSAQEFCPPGETLSWLILVVFNDSTLSTLCVHPLGILFHPQKPTHHLSSSYKCDVHMGINKNIPSNWICHIMLTQVGAPKPGRAQLLEGIDKWYSELSAHRYAHVVTPTWGAFS